MTSTLKNKTPIITVLLTGTFMAVLNQTLLATALPSIMKDLNIDLSTAQWLTTAFMLVNGIMIPISAFLIGTFTTRKLFIGAMVSFALGTLIAAFAPSFTFLLAGRVLQAAGAGIMMPLTQVVILSIFPMEKRGSAMGLIGIVNGLAPAIGPTLAGWMVVHFPWRSLFYVVLPIAVINIILAYFIMKNVTEKTSPKMDIFSIVLSSIGFGGLLYGFSVASTYGWGSIQVLGTIVLGLIALVWFIRRQFKLEQPMLEFRVFKDPTFSITTVLGVIVFASMIGAETLIPIFMQDMLGFSALESGLVLLPGALLMGVMMPITGRIFDKFGARWLAIIGFFVITVTTFLLTSLTPSTSFSYMLIVYMIRMFGISMVMMPVQTAGLNRLTKDLIPHGTAMYNTIRMIGGSIVTAILVTVMSSNTINPTTTEGMIQGVNAAFIFATILSLVGVVFAFFVKDREPQEQNVKQ